MPSPKVPANTKATSKKSNTPLIVGVILVILGIVVLAIFGLVMTWGQGDAILGRYCPPGLISAWSGGAPDRFGNFPIHCYTQAEIDQRKEDEKKGYTMKPVIMLYATRDLDFTVTPQFSIRDGYIYPALDNGSWSGKLIGGTDGNIMIKNQPYSYLFWEGITDKIYNPSEGNVVAKSDTTQYLERALTSYGLNAREREDFITFWAPRLIVNDYNMISFVNAEYAQAQPLKVTPTPDYTQRVFMVYKKVDQNFQIAKQQFAPAPPRHGFSLIEWGGQELK